MLLNVQITLLLLPSLLLLIPIISTNIHELNEAVFLDPRTHSALIHCPLDFTPSSDIQWYDVANHRYEADHGRYYRINGSQPFDREFICSSLSQSGAGSNEKYRIKIRTYGKSSHRQSLLPRWLPSGETFLDRPLTIRTAFLRNITNTSITIDWEDDNYNRNANITYYELVLK